MSCGIILVEKKKKNGTSSSRWKRETSIDWDDDDGRGVRGEPKFFLKNDVTPVGHFFDGSLSVYIAVDQMGKSLNDDHDRL